MLRVGNAELLLFALDESRAFAQAVGQALGIPLAPLEERAFDDGEHKTRPLVSVRDRDVYVVQALHGDATRTVNDKLVRLLFFLGALRDASAGRITAVVPYLAYARKDRKSQARDPVTTRYVAQLFEAVGIDCILTLDVHNLAAYQNAFRCGSEHLEANPLFVTYFAAKLPAAPITVVAPDAGGIKRAESFRLQLAVAAGRPIAAAFAEKYRRGGVVSGDALVGDVDGRVAIIVDDLISGGTTIARTAAACRQRGAQRVFAAASHGVFAPAANTTLVTADIEQIVVTDTMPPLRLTDDGIRSRLVQLSVAPLFAKAIGRLHGGGSITELHGG